MRPEAPICHSSQSPALLQKANMLGEYIKALDVPLLASSMKISPKVAAATKQLFADWRPDSTHGRPAIDAFIGDIYSGLQVQSFSPDDRQYANEHLFILSGLYGILRALDTIQPYRCEMAYRFPDKPYDNLYKFWNDAIARTLPEDQAIINLSSVEYTSAVFPHLRDAFVVTPKFLTMNSKTHEPTFVTVHAKVARGAFAHWLITHHIDDITRLPEFTGLGYHYDATLSTTTQPIFVCQEFGGIGMSVRLT